MALKTNTRYSRTTPKKKVDSVRPTDNWHYITGIYWLKSSTYDYL